MPSGPWTKDEDLALLSGMMTQRTPQITGRSSAAIKSRKQHLRRKMGLDAGRCPWSKAEDSRLRKYYGEPIAKLALRFPLRTLGAVKTRRRELNIPARQIQRPWKATEVALLKRMWATAPMAEILKAFPGRKYHSLSDVAKKNKVRRPTKPPQNDLREAIRIRCREDGISLRGLCKELGYSRTYLHRSETPIAIDRAAEIIAFFGGRLVPDWQDE